MTSSSSRWDEIDEFKGEKIYESKEGRLRAIAHIIKEYLQVKKLIVIQKLWMMLYGSNYKYDFKR